MVPLRSDLYQSFEGQELQRIKLLVLPKPEYNEGEGGDAMEEVPYYLKTGTAGDLENRKERKIYRILEIFPGFLVWATFILAIVLSYLAPLWVAVFMIGFALFWLLKILYFSAHLRASYTKMRMYQKIDWIAKLRNLPKEQYQVPVSGWEDIWHLVIFPIFTEPYEVVRPAVAAVAQSTWPKDRIIVILAAEETGEDGQEVARRLKEEFRDTFGYLFVTVHPKGLPGEIPGKGANERWAGFRAKELIDREKIPYEQVIVSSLDSDTVVYPDYFSVLAYHYLTVHDPLHVSYQPVPLFINNIWEAPAISRVIAFSSTFWHTMNQERPEKHLTFSSHSMPFKVLVDIDFWQPNVVSEDSRIFWQAFLYYNGNYRVESIHYPVQMDANVAKSLWRTLINVYKQQRRWAYGIADVPYFLFGYWKKRKEISAKRMRQYAIPVIEGFYSWATHAVLLLALGWLPIILGGEDFNQTLFSYNLPRVTRVILTIAMIGIISSAYLSIRILPPRPPQYGRWKYSIIVFQWFLVPVTLIVFGAFPAIEAITRLMVGKYMGFWVTEKHRKSAS